jgi:hypothetical protein
MLSASLGDMKPLAEVALEKAAYLDATPVLDCLRILFNGL